MSASLVGSEMCIRDSAAREPARIRSDGAWWIATKATAPTRTRGVAVWPSCLLYTSDAADDM
eukprot:8365515-Alexandrium_andersonii.AAC.1